MQVVMLKLSDIGSVTDPSSPIFDPRSTKAPEKRLVASLGKHGVLKPVLVVHADNLADFGVHLPYLYEVRDGRHRVAAARAAGLTEIPAIVTAIDSVAAFNSVALHANVHFEETFADTQAKVERLVAQGVSFEELCEILSDETASTLKTRVKLAAIAAEEPAVKELVEANALTVATAAVVTSGTTPEERETIAEVLTEMAKEAIETVAETGELPKKGAPVAVALDPRTEEVVATPTHAAATAVKDVVQGKDPEKQKDAPPAAKVAAVKAKEVLEAKGKKVKAPATPKAAGPVKVVYLDAALATSMEGRAVLMERLGTVPPAFIAGFRAALALAKGEQVAAEHADPAIAAALALLKA